MSNFSILPNANMQILAETAESLGINVTILEAEKGRLKLEKDGLVRTVWQKSLGLNTSASIEKSRNKKTVAALLKQHGLPVPQGEVEITSSTDLQTLSLPPYPLVVKPTLGEKAHDVFVGIKDQQSLETALTDALTRHDSLLIQPQIPGYNDRLFVLHGQVIGAARRHPPTLTGDDTHTIEELINIHNQKLLSERVVSGRRTLNRLLNTPRIIWHLENQGLSLTTILEHNHTITLYPISNFQAGGSVETIPVTEYHPSIITSVLTAVELVGLTEAGLDLMIIDHKKPADNNIVFLEINSDPGLRLHEWPNKGVPQPVTAALLQALFDLH